MLNAVIEVDVTITQFDSCFITFQRQPSTLWEPCEWNAALSCSNMSWSCRSRGRTFKGHMLLIVQSPSDIFWTLARTFKMFKTYRVYSRFQLLSQWMLSAAVRNHTLPNWATSCCMRSTTRRSSSRKRTWQQRRSDFVAAICKHIHFYHVPSSSTILYHFLSHSIMISIVSIVFYHILWYSSMFYHFLNHVLPSSITIIYYNFLSPSIILYPLSFSIIFYHFPSSSITLYHHL